MASPFNGIIPGAQALSEWGATFKGIIVGCGEASALVVDHIMKGTPISAKQLQDLINQAASSGHLDWQGVGQTATAVQWDLQQAGIQSSINYNVGGGNLRAAIESALTSGKPVILGVNRGSALQGETSNIGGHFITIVGENTSGFVVADPNTKEAVGGNFVTDTLTQLQNANPFAAITPGGTGPNTSGTSQGSGGILDIGSAIQNLASNLSPTNIAQGIGQGIVSAIKTPFNSIGITAVSDFMWRFLFISLALIIIAVGLVAVFHDQVSAANEKGQQAAEMAAM